MWMAGLSPAMTKGGSCGEPGTSWSDDADVLELPWIVAVEVLGKQKFAVLQRRPVAIDADDLPEIGPGDLQDAGEIQLLRLDGAPARVFDCPDRATKHGGGDLQRGGVVV